MTRRMIFSPESVTRGHPDEICDQVADAIADAFLYQDSHAEVAAECAVSTGLLFLAVNSVATVSADVTRIVRDVIAARLALRLRLPGHTGAHAASCLSSRPTARRWSRWSSMTTGPRASMPSSSARSTRRLSTGPTAWRPTSGTPCSRRSSTRLPSVSTSARRCSSGARCSSATASARSIRSRWRCRRRRDVQPVRAPVTDP